MAASLPDYIRSSVPVAASKRAAWHKNTFPSYAGIFLWVAFYLGIAGPTLSKASPAVCLLGLAVGSLLCFALYYYAPGMLGMQTGRPLYIVGTSTFGTTGGYLMPGLLMGLLQIGWFAVATSIATEFIMKGLHQNSRALAIVIAVVWAYGLGWVAIKGINYVARVAEILNWVPIIMIGVVFWANRGGIAAYRPATNDSWGGFLAIVAFVIGFFATAGAAGADFGMNNRNRRDVVLGGLTGVALTGLLAGCRCFPWRGISAQIPARHLITATRQRLRAWERWRRRCFSFSPRLPVCLRALPPSSRPTALARCFPKSPDPFQPSRASRWDWRWLSPAWRRIWLVSSNSSAHRSGRFAAPWRRTTCWQAGNGRARGAASTGLATPPGRWDLWWEFSAIYPACRPPG